MPTGFTTVSASHLQDATGTLITNATIYFKPVANNGVGLTFRAGGAGGQVVSETVSAQVTNGAFTIELADTALTSPVNVAYQVTVTDNTGGYGGKALLGIGYSIQPTGDTWDFDAYVPNFAPQLTVQTGPSGLDAYQLALKAGYVGTEAQWLFSLKGATGDVSRAQLATLQALVTDYASGNAVQCGSVAVPATGYNPGVASVASCHVTDAGYLESITVPLHTAAENGSLDIVLYSYAPANINGGNAGSYTVQTRFTVSLSPEQVAIAPGLCTFHAGVDYAPIQAAANTYLGWTSNGTVSPGYSTDASAGAYAYFGDPGPVGTTTGWFSAQGAAPIACVIRTPASAAVATNPYTGKRIIALGDSLTSSYGHSLYQNTPYQQDNNPAPCYAQIAANKLGATWAGRFSTSGISAGAFYAPEYTHLANVGAAAPNADVCLIFLGTNQVSFSLGTIADAPALDDEKGTHSFYAQMRYVIETTQAFNPAMQIIGLLPFQQGNNNGPCQVTGGFGGSRDNQLMSASGRAITVQIRAALMEIYSYYGIPWIDLWTVFGINSFNTPDYLGADNVHPNDAGYERLGERVAEAMLCLDSSYIPPATSTASAPTSLDNCPIGQTTPAAGNFTTLSTQSGNLYNFASVGRDVYGSIDFGAALLLKNYSGSFAFENSGNGAVYATVIDGVFQETFAPPASSSSPGRLGQFTDGQLVAGGPFYRFLCVIDNPNGTIANAWLRAAYDTASW